jgi:uncharacterized protein (TIGR03086 family)
VTLLTTFDDVTREFGQRLVSVASDQWDAQTPCADWDVRQLAGHVLDEQHWLAALVSGETIEQVGERFSGDQLGSDPSGSWARACAASSAVLARPGALDRVVGLSYGEVVAAEYAREVLADTVVHTWDLARAIGADERLDDELVAFATDVFAPRLPAWRAAGVIGEPVEVDGDAQARLLASLGRRP